MRSADIKNQTRVDLLQKAQGMIAEGKMTEAADHYNQYYESLTQEILAEAKQIAAGNDKAILQARGTRQLTQAETGYYEGLIQALGQKDWKQAITNLDLTIPETVFEGVFEDLVGEYPLLDAINFRFLPGNVKFLMNTGERNKAVWGDLCADIVTEVSQGLKTVQAGQHKLSAFVYLCKSMLVLGPVWIDRFVREVLRDAALAGLEDGIVNGNGVNAPIGMIRNLAGPIDPETGYPEKTAVALASFGQADLGAVLKDLAVTGNGRNRSVGTPVFIYNPADYYLTVFPAANVLTGSGYINVVPFPLKMIASEAVPEGKAVIGLTDRYFATVATSDEGEIEYSDHYKFLEDDRTYVIKLLGNGMPMDNNAFKYLDITNLKPFVPQVGIEGVVLTQEVPAG